MRESEDAWDRWERNEEERAWSEAAAVTAKREAAADTERESAGNWDRLKREREEWVRGQEAHLRAKEVESRLSRERREEEARTRHEEERRMLREIVPEWKLEKMKREQERREEKERNIRWMEEAKAWDAEELRCIEAISDAEKRQWEERLRQWNDTSCNSCSEAHSNAISYHSARMGGPESLNGLQHAAELHKGSKQAIFQVAQMDGERRMCEKMSMERRRLEERVDLWNIQSVRQKQEDPSCLLLAGSHEREEADTRVEKEGKEKVRFAEGKSKDRLIQEDEIRRDRERERVEREWKAKKLSNVASRSEEQMEVPKSWMG